MKLSLHRRNGYHSAAEGGQELRVRVRGGVAAGSLRGRAGERVTLLVCREDASPHGDRLVLPELGHNVSLPLRQDVRIDLGVPARGEYQLTSETGALRGTLVLQ